MQKIYPLILIVMLHFTLKLAPDLIVRSLQCFGYKVYVFPKFMQGESTKKIWLFRGAILIQ